MSKIIKTLADWQVWRTQQHSLKHRIALVPTMGALHQGHLSLVKTARLHAEKVCVSIFVNPLQFGPSEDFEKYPRPLETDTRLLREAGVEAIFIPSPQPLMQLGVPESATSSPLNGQLCGGTRPIFFKGVCSIIYRFAKYLRPDSMVFGLKDYQQCVIIRDLVLKESLQTELFFAPLKRSLSGLALSSRNAYLSPQQSKRSELLSSSLKYCRDLFVKKQHTISEAIKEARHRLAQDQGIEVEYLEARAEKTLTKVPDTAVYKQNHPFILCTAIHIDGLRLIDNLPLNLDEAYCSLDLYRAVSHTSQPPYKQEVVVK